MQRNAFYLAFALTAAIALWMGSGMLANSKSNEPATTDGPASPTPSVMQVAVRTLTTESIARQITLNGELLPARELMVRARIGSHVGELLVDKGERVKTGQTLLRLAPEARPAQLKQAQALLKSRQLELEGMRQLKSRGLQAQTGLMAAEAAVAEAEALVSQAELTLAYLEVKAPFAGVIDSREVELGAQVERGDPLFMLVDDSQLKASAQITQQSVSGLTLGQPVEVRMLSGETARGTLSFIARQGNSATHSYPIEATLDNHDGRLRAGSSATLKITLVAGDAHYIDPALLSLDSDGQLGVKAVDEDNRVINYPVSLIRSDAEGVWVAGLPPRLHAITQGQGFVTAGERVVPIDAEPPR